MSDVQTSACKTNPAFAGCGEPTKVGFVSQAYDSSSDGRRAGRVSVVIPLHGGEDDIRGCLESLTACADLLRDIVVVDNASPDGAADVAESFPWCPEPDGPPLRVVRMERNAGFAAACNRGAAETSGAAILFLNSDTVVPRAGLVRLIEGTRRSGMPPRPITCTVDPALPRSAEPAVDMRSLLTVHFARS
ncbi:MAG: glycosyltransferase [Armatimonadetes bacterium]|nr:glycosyltransferase [Armatimonadota bacterium]